MAWLNVSRTAAEIALLQRLKGLLDPAGVLNPNRVSPQVEPQTRALGFAQSPPERRLLKPGDMISITHRILLSKTDLVSHDVAWAICGILLSKMAVQNTVGGRLPAPAPRLALIWERLSALRPRSKQHELGLSQRAIRVSWPSNTELQSQRNREGTRVKMSKKNCRSDHRRHCSQVLAFITAQRYCSHCRSQPTEMGQRPPPEITLCKTTTD